MANAVPRMVRRWELALLLAVVLAALFAVQSLARAQTPVLPAPPLTTGGAKLDTGRVIVQFRPGAVAADQAAAHAQFGAQVIKRIPALSIEVVELPDPAATVAVAAAYANNPLVSFAEPDALMSFGDGTIIPNDPLYDPTQFQWQHPAVDSPEAWGVTTGGSALRITICDTGVSQTHPDLLPNLNGALGRNVADDPVTNDWSPVHWHGTFVAGMAAAIGNNGIGVAGAAWTAEIVPVRISNFTDGGAFIADMAQCIVYGADLASIAINLSYQTYSNGQIFNTILEAADYANAHGSVLVVASGNGNANPVGDADPENIFYVASTDEGDTKSSFSNFGPYVDLAAPGGSVVSTAVCVQFPGCGRPGSDLYARASGTSFSAPLTAGAALLVVAAHGGPMSPAAIRSALTVGACDLGAPGEDDFFGAGLLNVHHALHGESCLGAIAIEISPATVDFGVVPLAASVSTDVDGGTMTVTNTGSGSVNLSVEYVAASADCGGGDLWTAVTAGTTPASDEFALWAKFDAGGFVGVPTTGSAALGGPLAATVVGAPLDVRLDMPSSTSFAGPCTTQIVIVAVAAP